jgi:hypothetical protein
MLIRCGYDISHTLGAPTTLVPRFHGRDDAAVA